MAIHLTHAGWVSLHILYTIVHSKGTILSFFIHTHILYIRFPTYGIQKEWKNVKAALFCTVQSGSAF